MSDSARLIIIHFDSMENRIESAIDKEELFFKSDEEKNWYCKIGEYLKTLNYTPYLAWDNQIYPQFKIEKINWAL